jgi:hypothetical protein
VSRGGALARAVAVLLEDEQESKTRFVDLCVSLRVCDVDAVTKEWIKSSDEELIRLGGCWDKRRKRWSTKRRVHQVCVVRVHRGQEAAARELAAWFALRRQGGRGPQWVGWWRYWTLLLIGGRRGGKTHLAIIALVLFAVMEPKCRAWAISPTLERGDELEQGLRQLFPRRWYRYRGGGAGKPSQFRLPNGARILCLSGHKGSSLKAGRVDLAVYNEGQQMSKGGWLQLRGAIADKGGLVIVCANPPDTPIGRWIEEVYNRSLTRKNKVKSFPVVAKENPFVEHQALADIAVDADDPLVYRREVLGEFVPIGDVVHHAWSDENNWRDPDPSWIDITAEFTQEKLGQAFGFVVLMDFQLTPAMIGLPSKIFRDPKRPEFEILAIVDEAIVDKANEYQLLDELEEMRCWSPRGRLDVTYRGWRVPQDTAPIHCSVVMDASGFYQDGEHSRDRTSELALRSRGWKHLYRPRPDGKLNNPDLIDRSKVVNGRLHADLLVVARHCPYTARAMRLWELRNGFPYKRSVHAHISDCIGYGAYRFWSRPKIDRKAEFTADQRLTRGREMKGIFRP